MNIVQRESYIWQSDKAIRQSDEIITQSDEVITNWLLFIFGNSIKNILNYTSESGNIESKDIETAIIKAVE